MAGWKQAREGGAERWGQKVTLTGEKTKNSAKCKLEPKRSPTPTVDHFYWTPLVPGIFTRNALSSYVEQLCDGPLAGAKKQGSAGKRDSGPSVAHSKASLLPSPGAQGPQKIKQSPPSF